MNADLSQALAVAERLLIGADGRAHLPPTLRTEMRALTPKQQSHTAPLTAAELAAVRRLRGTGHTYREIEKRLKLSYDRVAKACQEFGSNHHNDKTP